jgi:Flp pilus assembly protein protease CpaA
LFQRSSGLNRQTSQAARSPVYPTPKESIMAELRALLELLSMLVTDPRTGVLLALLAVAAVSDYRSFRIPNLVTGGGILFALVYNTVVRPAMHTDWTWAPAGMLLGFGAMLPMYLLRIMGAGDVKLMAMVGAFLGAAATATALLFCVVTAGVAVVVERGKRPAASAGSGALGGQTGLRRQHRHRHRDLPGCPAGRPGLSALFNSLHPTFAGRPP